MLLRNSHLNRNVNVAWTVAMSVGRFELRPLTIQFDGLPCVHVCSVISIVFWRRLGVKGLLSIQTLIIKLEPFLQ